MRHREGASQVRETEECSGKIGTDVGKDEDVRVDTGEDRNMKEGISVIVITCEQGADCRDH